MPLVVYKSSAGSGKTTTLVNEYLNICLKRPHDFRHILAITFTNKAAHEMKERIIKTLQTIISSDWQKDERILLLYKKTQLDDKIFEVRALELLKLITHRFEDFSVSTIDSFVHKVIRTFANEVHLPPNFEVVLNNDDLIPDIINELYEKVGTDPVLTQILVKFVLDQSENEKSPDPTFMLSKFISNQLSEESFIEVKKLEGLSTAELWNIIKNILQQLEIHKANIEQLAQSALSLLEENSISSADLSGGRNGIFSFFNKAQQVRTRAATDLPASPTVLKNLAQDKWFSAKAKAGEKANIEAIKEKLLILFEKLNSAMELYFRYYLISRKIYVLALVHELRQLLTAHTETTGKVHISEFNKLVYNEVADQPVPFIYERLGKKYQYFLIDEFQDTSVLQWNNLLPLIGESLAYNKFNMLVGDAKQAIYRFRNGEVELFSSLPQLYNNDGSALALERENQLKNAYEEIPLDQNWRSHEEIIGFNNQFFDYLKAGLGGYIQKVYENHQQSIPNDKKPGGLVDIELISGENKEEILQQKQEKLIEIVDNLLKNNYTPSDIGILCRTGAAVRAYASHLIDYGYSVLSEESLLVANAPEVQVLAAFFQLLVNPANAIAQACLLENIRVLRLDKGPADDYYRRFFSIKHTQIQSILTFFDTEISHDSIENKPLTEIADFVLRNIIKTTRANIFVQYYFEFLHHAPQSIEDMNQLWEDKKGTLFIATPENANAIRVMTVHKSKGLAFEIVITDTDLETIKRTRDEFWMESGLKDAEQLDVGLFPLSKALSLIYKENIYEKEVERSTLDYLNVLYVAFTRPIKGLYILANKNTDDKPGILGGWLIEFVKLQQIYNENQTHYTFGELPVQLKDQQDDIVRYMLENWPSFSWHKNMWIAKPETESDASMSNKSDRDYGIFVHQLLSQIRNINDIDPVIEHQEVTGNLNEQEAALFTKILTDITSHNKLSHYYSPSVWSRNETEILLKSGEIIRPDRVVKINNEYIVIDYKTGNPQPEHIHQMNKYKKAIKTLGFERVKACLVYLFDEIEIVDV